MRRYTRVHADIPTIFLTVPVCNRKRLKIVASIKQFYIRKLEQP